MRWGFYIYIYFFICIYNYIYIYTFLLFILICGLQARGQFSEAEPLYREAFDCRKKELGDKHPQTLTSANNLAGQAQASNGQPIARAQEGTNSQGIGNN